LFLDRADVASTANLLRLIAAEADQPAEAEPDQASANPNRAYMAKLRAARSPDRLSEDESSTVMALAEFLERHPRGVFVDRSPHDPARANRATHGGAQAEARAEKRSPPMAFAHGRLPD
jgi:hypothetical protein